MSQLFVALYLDEDVDVLIASLLNARGFSATTTLKANNIGADDSSQLEFAASHSMAMVTHNRLDFERLVAEKFSAGKSHGGVIIAVRRPPHEIAKRLLAIINQNTADEMNNQLIYI